MTYYNQRSKFLSKKSHLADHELEKLTNREDLVASSNFELNDSLLGQTPLQRYLLSSNDDLVVTHPDSLLAIGNEILADTMSPLEERIDVIGMGSKSGFFFNSVMTNM